MSEPTTDRPQDDITQTGTLPSAVSVTGSNGDPIDVPFQEGANVGYYLNAADVKARFKTITLNGERVDKQAEVAPGASIVVARRLANG